MNEREIFEKAIEIRDRGQRDTFLNQACGHDDAQRKRIDELLASHDQASGLLNVPVVDPIPSPQPDGPPPTLELLPAKAATSADAAQDDHDDDVPGPADLRFLQPSPQPGSLGRLGHYEILQVLGQGAFGIVFKAFDEKLHRYVAVKAMSPELAATSPPRKRFLREARSVAALKHENIVQIYSVEEQPLPYLAMEFVDGQTLQQKLDGAGPLEVAEILHLGRQMAAGLAAAHEKGLIHRDIKPGNILLEAGAEQKVKITDFGLARAADDATMTRTGTIAGTPMYMAPEQALGQTLDQRADLFSLGSVLYQMTCGRPPFRGANALAVLKRVVEEEPRPIRDILPEAPEWLCAIIAKLHAKNPDERYQSAREVADLLARCQNELQVTGKVTCVPVRGRVSSKSSQDATNAEATPVSSSRSPASSSNRPLIIAAAAVLLVLGGLIVTELTGITSFVRNPNSEPKPVASGVSSGETATTKVQTTKTTGWAGWPADAPKPAIAPFDAEQAKKHQEEWAAYLKVPVEFTNSIGMKFRLIPPGEFTMGMTKEEAEAIAARTPGDESVTTLSLSSAPPHKVRLTQAYYLGTHEVTQEQYEEVVGVNPSHFSASGAGQEQVKDDDPQLHPVEMVSFIDAAEFCIKLSKEEQLKPVYFSADNVITLLPGNGYRLPTEAEWESACRAGTNTTWFHGEQESTLGTVAWFSGNSGGRTHAVGQLKANPFGLYDVHGNVFEWCQDWHDAQAYNTRWDGVTEDPQSPDAGSARVLRGVGWDDASAYCHSAFRFADSVGSRLRDYGLRVLLPVDAVRLALSRTDPASPKPSLASGRTRVTPENSGQASRPATSAAADDAIDYVAEKKVAERLLRLGKGKASLVNKDGQNLGELREPLPVEPFSLHNVNLGSTDLTDDELAALAGCRGIRNLVLSINPRLTDAGLKRLGRLPRLTGLDVWGTAFGDEGLKLLENFPALEGLGCAYTSVTPTGWTALTTCPRLRRLAASNVGESGLRAIIRQCPELRNLWVSDPSIDLAPLAELRYLTTLHTGPNALTPAGLETLRKLPFLNELLLDQPDVEGLARLSQGLPQLTALRFRGNLPTSDQWESVTRIPGLLELEITQDIAVDRAALQRVATMRELRKFFVGDDSSDKAKFRAFTDADVAEFRRTRPDVELTIAGQTYAALDDWPGKFEGSTSIAPWAELGANAPAPASAPFSPEVARQRQDEWARHLGQPAEFTNSIGMKFRLIPPTEAVRDLGTPEQPRRALQRVLPYYLGTTEVTVGQFKKFVEATGYVTDAERLKNGNRLFGQPDPSITWKTPGYPVSDDLPVNVVSPVDVHAFCAWLSRSEEPIRAGNSSPAEEPMDRAGRQTVVYRLPSEFEWLFATRAGSEGVHGFAGTAQGVVEYAWATENIEGKPTPVQPVATKRANPFGLYDVIGNVWEYFETKGHLIGGVLGGDYASSSSNLGVESRVLGSEWLQLNVGFRVLREIRAAEPSPPAKFGERPVLVARNAPLSSHAAVLRPTPISGIRSWTIELPAHQVDVTSIAWSPKGDMIATAAEDKSVRLWDREGNLRSLLLGHAGSVGPHGICFSPNGAFLASVDYSSDPSAPSALRIWDVHTGTCRAVAPSSRWIHCVAFSPDGGRVVYGPWGECVVLDVTTGESHAFRVDGIPASITWSPDGTTLCVALEQQTAPVLIDATSGKILESLSAPDISPESRFGQGPFVQWSPDGRSIGSAYGRQIRFWDAETRRHLRTFDAGFGLITGLAWHKEGGRMAVTGQGEPGGCVILDTQTGQATRVQEAWGGFFGAAWSPDGAELVGHGSIGNQVGLHFLDGQTAKRLRSGPERGRSVVPSTFLSADGERVECKHVDQPFRLEFDAATGRLLERRKAPRGHLLATSPGDRWRAYSGYSFELQYRQVSIEPRRLDQDPVTITSPGMSWLWRSDPTGNRIAHGFQRDVAIWDTTTGESVGQLAHPVKLWAFEWSPDGRQIATIAEDKTIRIWDVAGAKTVAEFRQFPEELYLSNPLVAPPTLAWTRDGRSLWIRFLTRIGRLELDTGRVVSVEDFSQGGHVDFLTLGPDGDRLLVREGYYWTFLRDRDGSRHLLGQLLGYRPQWHPDARRFLGADWGFVRGYDVAARRRLGTLWPMITGDHWLCVGPTGHYRGSSGIEEQIVYVAQLDDGSHVTLTPAEFAQRFGWKNNPEQAILLKLSE